MRPHLPSSPHLSDAQQIKYVVEQTPSYLRGECYLIQSDAPDR